MDSGWFLIPEFLLFGLVVVFCVWQLRSLRRYKRAAEEKDKDDKPTE